MYLSRVGELMFPCSVSFHLQHRVSWMKKASRRDCGGEGVVMSRKEAEKSHVLVGR